MTPLMGTILLFAGSYAPQGWAFCEGQLLSIGDHAQLFSLLGTAYGGNGVTNFGLPDLRSRVPVGAGQGPGLSPYMRGQVAGTETAKLSVAQLPAHTHHVMGNDSPPAVATPRTAFLGGARIYNGAGAESAMNPTSVSETGEGAPHANLPPVLAMHYIIAVDGEYPPRP